MTKSWVITVKRTGQVFETFNPKLADTVSREKCIVETAHDYLARINQKIKQSQG